MSRKSKQAWVTGASYDAPSTLSAYEKEVIRLGLQDASLEDLLTNPALVAWANQNKNDKYIPEILLSKWKLTNEWSGHKQRNHRISYGDVRAELEESTATPQITTH